MSKKTRKTAKTISTLDFFKLFPSEARARAFVEKHSWEDGKPTCPHCGERNAFVLKRSRGYRCRSCRRDFTVRVGTIFEGSNISFKKWLFAMYLVVTARKGISSMQISKELGVTQKTSWFMLKRIQKACENNDIILAGEVEVDEAYFGGKEYNKHSGKKLNQGRGTTGKTSVIGALQRGGPFIAKVIPDTSAETMQSFIADNVTANSRVYTDDHRSYIGLDQRYDAHEVVKHSEYQYGDGPAHTNGIESCWAVMKRGYKGTNHFWSKKYMQFYLNEFMFRMDEGSCEVDTIDRIIALVRRSRGKRMTYDHLVNGEATNEDWE